MKLRAIQKPQLEVVPKEDRGWFGGILSSINDFIEQAATILNAGILFGDNMQGVEHVYDFVYQSDAISLPLGFAWRLSLPPKSFQMAGATEDGAPVVLLTSWRFTETSQVQLVQVSKIDSTPTLSALTVGARYRIRVRVQP